MATNNYRAGGGGGFDFLANLPSLLEGSEDIKLILASYLTKRKTIIKKASWNPLFVIPSGAKVFFETSSEALDFLGAMPLKELKPSIPTATTNGLVNLEVSQPN